MDINQLKQIQLYRQHITNKADKETIIRDLCGVQCQFLANAYYSLKIRCKEQLTEDKWNHGLVKNWTIRGTVHVFSENDLPLFIYNNNGSYLNGDWDDEIRDHKLIISGKRKQYFAGMILEWISQGINLRDQLRRKCREVGMTDTEEQYLFHPWSGIFRELCKRGFLNYQVTHKKAYAISPRYKPLQEADAQLEQMRRYLYNIAPATIRDIAYFFGYPQAKVKTILSKLPVKQLKINDKDYYYLGKLEENYPEIPDCVFLSGFDQLLLGYQKQDSIYLPKQYLRKVFNLTGIIFPTILFKGTIIGKWKKHKHKLAITLFEDVNARDRKIISENAEALWGEEVKEIIFIA